MDGVINIRVNGYSIVKDHNCGGAQGESKSTSLRIEFGKDWDGFTRTVTFWNALGQNPAKIDCYPHMADGDERVFLVPVPGEATEFEGMITFVIDGYNEGENGVIKRSVEDTLKILPSRKAKDAVNASDPTPDQMTQLQGEIEKINEEIHNAMASAEDAAESAREADLSLQGARECTAYAENAVRLAGDAADRAKEEADRAEGAVGKTSFIGDNGKWFTWDAERGQFVDTGVPATGDVEVEGMEGDAVDVKVSVADEGTIRIAAALNDGAVKSNHIAIGAISETHLQSDSVSSWAIKENGIGKREVNGEIVTKDDFATTEKPGIVRLWSGGGLQNLPGTDSVAVASVGMGQINMKRDFFCPVTADVFDYAIAKGTHQELGGSYDPMLFYTCYDMEGKQGQLPVSYDAVFGYVGEVANSLSRSIDSLYEVVGDIETALDELHTYAQGLVSGGEN